MTLGLVASPPAFAQLNFTSTDFAICGETPSSVAVSDFNGDSHLGLAIANNGALFDDGGVEVLLGLGGNHLLCGGNGPDNLSGGEGDDTVDDGRGKDRLDGAPGADRLTG